MMSQIISFSTVSIVGLFFIICRGFWAEKIQEDSLDSIPSPSLSVKIQIIGGKEFLPIHLKQTFPPIIWIVTWDRIQATF